MSDQKSLEEFKSEIDQADWSLLEDHFKRGALFIIDEKLKLEEVANAFSKDYSQIVKIWLDEGSLKLVSDDEAKTFSEKKYEKIVNFLIVQPYVIVQLLS